MHANPVSATPASAIAGDVTVVVVAHWPLASALLEVVRHVFEEDPGHARHLDVGPADDPADSVRALIRACDRPGATGLLLLVDAYGATPSHVAQRARTQLAWPSAVIAGVSLPMLLGVLDSARRGAGLEDLTRLAVNAAWRGIRVANSEY